MAKGKSSATSKTRKKHERKAAGPADELPPNPKDKKPKQRGQKKAKKEERVKVFIPPVKPSPVRPDPLETTGLGHRLPPDLLVVLRGLAKKDVVTKTRALEELQVGWVDKVLKGEDEEEKENVLYALGEMTPVWLHHLPALFLHPSRRIRILTGILHTSFLRISSIRDEIFFSLRENTSDQTESILGSWAMAAHDIDRAVAGSIRLEAWISVDVETPAETSLESSEESPAPSTESPTLEPKTKNPANKFILDTPILSSLTSFIHRAALDPNGVYAELNPPPPAHQPAPNSRQSHSHPNSHVNSHSHSQKRATGRPGTTAEAVRSKADDLESQLENASDRKARIRVGAVGAVRWVLETTASKLQLPTSKHWQEFFANPLLWTCLYHAESCPFVASDSPDEDEDEDEDAEDGEESTRFESFGFAQPSVRRSAWGLVQTLLKVSKGNSDTVEKILPILSRAILRSAWVEPDVTVHAVMWQPVLTFLKEFPKAWELELASLSAPSPSPTNPVGEDDDESDKSDDEDDHEHEQEDLIDQKDDSMDSKDSKTNESTQPHSIAYREFLHFLELGCNGSPSQGYPAVVIILSTIPSSILASTASLSSPLGEFFTSFWAAIDGRALSSLRRYETSAAFLSSLMECMVFLVKRVQRDTTGQQAALLLGGTETAETVTPDAGRTATKRLIEEQVGRVWAELSSKALKVRSKTVGVVLARTLGGLITVDEDIFETAWKVLSEAMKGSGAANSELVSSVLDTFRSTFKAPAAQGGDDSDHDQRRLHLATDVLMREVLQMSLDRCVAVLRTHTQTVSGSGAADGGGGGEAEGKEAEKGGMGLLVDMIDVFGRSLFDDRDFAQRLDEISSTNAYTLLNTSPPVLFAYLTHRKDDERCLALWHTLLGEIPRHEDDVLKALSQLLDASQKNLLADHLKPQSDELDPVFGKLLAESLAGDAVEVQLNIVRKILQAPGHFLSEAGFRAASQSVVSAFTTQVELILRDESVPLESFEAQLHLLSAVFASDSVGIKSTLLPTLYIFAYLVPNCYESPDSKAFVLAQSLSQVWQQGVESGSAEQQGVFEEIGGKLRSLLLETQTRILPGHILQTISDLAAFAPKLDVLKDIIPSQEDVDAMLDSLSADPIDASLAVLDPLVPPSSAFSNKRFSPPPCDSRGYSTYARVLIALLQIFIDDRQLAKANIWALRHLLALSLYAEDFVGVTTAKSPVFLREALSSGLDELVSRVQQVTTYILTSSARDGWRHGVLGVLNEGKTSDNLDSLSKFLVDVIRHAQSNDSGRESRILHRVLQHAFDDADKTEADLWILFARKIEKTAPQTSMTIVSSVNEFAPDPPRLERYRNELAASLLGIPAVKADTEGLLNLRRLAASAPDAESDVVFLPQPRAVNVVKACQQWVSSDEDIDEEVESAMTLAFIHLVPILQNVPGGHWDFIFDVIENNLENCDWSDDLTLVTLARTLRLVIAIQNLTLTNKALRSDWEERQMPILTSIRDLAAAHLETIGISSPRSTCRGLVLSIVQNLPESLIDHNTLPKMCHLLTDPSEDVQKMTYQLMQQAAKKRTEHLVIEAGVDTEDSFKAELPLELIQILQQTINRDESEWFHQEQVVFGYLLGWLVLFDLFVDSSLKVRQSYIEQLRTLGLLPTYFIPNLLHLLRLDEGIIKAFKLDVWAVDEYYVQLYEPGTSFSLQLLTAHVYYRALLTVPSLIHTWVQDCKDRQLSASIITYTSTHFSPTIIRHELAHVRSPEALADLSDENFSVKVAGAVNEVLASYTVDDNQLEIKLKIPTDWPLHKIEIKDVRKVGVDENRWRGWLLAVQQIIWSQNGRILDGLQLFKKNVALHFEGQTECAICYSIISVMDGSLPRKPCRTCKNRFHSVCLLKWFNTSHSSSCPLCRSDML